MSRLRFRPKALYTIEAFFSVGAMTEPVDYLETWMTQLPNSLREIPIIYLAIPGTHDSMSYGIRSNAQVAPDAEPAVAKLYKVMPCVVRRWAITQRLNAVQQLVYGIR